MITQYEVPAIVQDCLPDLSLRQYPTRLSLVIYATMNEFSDYTHHALENNDLELAKKCFSIADLMYKEGDKVVRSTIENSFVATLSDIMVVSLDKMFMLKAMLPKALYKLAVQHTLNNTAA